MNEFQLPGPSSMDKQPRLNYYFRLESESSLASEEDAESILSFQGRETECVQDSEDTDAGSYFEYEVRSFSEGEEDTDPCFSSSGSDDTMLVAEEVIAAVLGDTSVEAWAPDGEEDSSTTDGEDFGKTDFWTCAQCKSKNNNPQFRLCEKCFQVRKNFYPPRPKRCKKRKIQSNKKTVNVDNLRSCLSGLSQDSGVGSSQEFPSLDFKEIKVPEQHLLSKGEPSSTSGATSESCSSSQSASSVTSTSCSSSSAVGTSNSGSVSNPIMTATIFNDTTTAVSRKRKYSETFSDSSDAVLAKKIVIEKPPLSTHNTNDLTESTTKNAIDINTESKDLCMMCTTRQKDGIFLHGTSAHSCCCYKCAVKTWKTTKRCPVCKRRVSNVVKLFTI